MAGAVPGRIDVAGGGRASLVHHDAVVAGDPRRLSKLRVGDDADPDHHQIGRDEVGAATNPLDVPAALEGADRGRQPHLDAAGAMGARVVAGHLGRRHPPEEPIRGLDDADLEPHPLRRRGHLQADVPSSHDGQPAARRELRADRLDVFQRPQVEDVPEVRAGDVEPPRAAPGGDDEVRELDRASVRERHLAAIGIDHADRVAEPELDVVAGVEALRAQEHPLPRELPGEVLLRERRALIRGRRLGSAYDDPAAVSGLAQAERGLAAGLAGAGDDGGIPGSGHRPGVLLP